MLRMGYESQLQKASAPLVAHIIYRLGIGGLENGLVNLINRTPPGRYRHAVICLKDFSDFRERIRSSDVQVYALNKREGHDWSMFFRLYRLLRRIRPLVVHTRNLAAIECQLPAALAGVRCRVHGEHGWDVFDPHGDNKKYQWLRRVYKPLVKRYIPLSTHLESYLRGNIRVPQEKITRICNGVDTDKFFPSDKQPERISGCPFTADNHFLIGTIGRMHGVKDQLTLVKAFIHLIKQNRNLSDRVRLVLVGDGPLRDQAIETLKSEQLENLSWLPGERNDIDLILRGLDLFILPSKAEGISNTILEAMATGLPVIATDVGGNPDLVVNGVTGFLVPGENHVEITNAIGRYLDDPLLIRKHRENSLQRVQKYFSLDSMVDRYLAVYDNVIRDYG